MPTAPRRDVGRPLHRVAPPRLGPLPPPVVAVAPDRTRAMIQPRGGERPRGAMPEISRFFGIVIRMFVEPGAPHHRPHFHAYYQGTTGIVAVDTIEVIAGDLPRPQARLVEAWAELHRR